MKAVKDYAELVVKLFPLLTGITFVFGYIGFHTFTAIYHLPVITTDISIIAGIGLLNMTYIAILYYATPRKRTPFIFEAFAIYWFFNLLLYSPIAIASSIITILMFYQLQINFKKKKIDYKKLREKAERRYLTQLKYDLVLCIISITVAIIFDRDFYYIVLAIYGLLHIIYRYKRKKQQSIFLVLLIFLSFPMMTMYYFINSSNVNILGLNSYQVEIYTKKDTLQTRFVFEDQVFYYNYNDSSQQVTSIRKDDILKVKTISEKKIKKTGYAEFIEMFDTHKFK